MSQQCNDIERLVVADGMDVTPESHHELHDGRGTPGAEPSRRTSRRAPRIRTACCDGRVPVCSSCSKAGVSCVDGGRQQEKYPRAYIASLQNRIQWLESMLTQNCPDIDLEKGPRIIRDGTIQDGNPADTAETALDPRGGGTHPDLAENIDPAITNESQQTTDDSQPDRLAHEIGLVSVTGGQDPRYIGPSSGYTFGRLITASIGLRNANHRQKSLQSNTMISTTAFQVAPSPLPTGIENALQLSAAYWDNIHCQYPFLHRPTHIKLMEHAYTSSDPSPIALFQVYMVLAISSTILSRRLKLPIPAEGYCATAMTYFDRIQLEGSLEGLQCLLLLQIYGMNNPSMGFNLWYLNYQCIANVLDLGLQRDVRASKNLSFLTQEMRTRIFWVVYSIDRTLATIMGRPIGLRDEACELRMPADLDDDALFGFEASNLYESSPTSNTMALHLIKLAQINSEIKYIANCISHKTPAHCYPQIPDIVAWQRDVLGRLDQWLVTLPRVISAQMKLCEIKYHEVVMLLLRPSPAIRNPSNESLRLCNQSAISTIRGYEELYRNDLLLYNWPTIHSVFLAGVSMLYCIWTVPSITKDTKLETLSADLNSASKVLCALAEHWVDAKRGRDVLDELSHATIRWIAESQKTGVTANAPRNTSQSVDNAPQHPPSSFLDTDNAQFMSTGSSNTSIPVMPSLDVTLSSEPWNTLFGISDETSLDFGIDSLFSDYQLDLDYGQSLPLDNQITDASILSVSAVPRFAYDSPPQYLTPPYESDYDGEEWMCEFSKCWEFRACVLYVDAAKLLKLLAHQEKHSDELVDTLIKPCQFRQILLGISQDMPLFGAARELVGICLRQAPKSVQQAFGVCGPSDAATNQERSLQTCLFRLHPPHQHLHVLAVLRNPIARSLPARG
ncbi:uncharacterized protein PAC_08054 [Phialocephala subalpina]|uniref:Xylanolytic transcriptional activator regulatory domain-containing protein n=1 Tax=Phialocephala subalpina TaxID=576137 RepID=A0A1L7WZG1_9HELO|nr:uncharacterized protein PAC_08054 [Phialocephala subalpina]